MSFPRYAASRDSGVEWLGVVPAHWNVVPIKQLGRLKGGAGFPHDTQGVQGEELHFHKVNALSRAAPDGKLQPSDNTISRDAALKLGAFVFPPGTLVFAKVGAALLLARVCELKEPACIDNNMMGLVIDGSRCEIGFVRYAMTLVRFDLIANPGAVPSLNEGQIGGFALAIPDRREQATITAFLNGETARIDALVEEQRRLIELLKEKRQAVISQAVTKGLDPDVPMKDSGVAWLGQIPAHWDHLALKRVSPSQTVGIVVNPSVYVASEGLPYLYGGDISEDCIDLDGCRRISAEDSERNAKTRLQAGDLVTVRVGAPGVTAVVPPEADGGNCASVMLIKRGNFDSRWLCYTMNDRVVRFQVEVVQYGAAQEQFNISHAVEFILPRPGRGEQTLIADHLDKETGRLDELVAETESAMTLLAERRAALISAAVTGKIDVRGFHPSPASGAV